MRTNLEYYFCFQPHSADEVYRNIRLGFEQDSKIRVSKWESWKLGRLKVKEIEFDIWMAMDEVKEIGKEGWKDTLFENVTNTTIIVYDNVNFNALLKKVLMVVCKENNSFFSETKMKS